jgi:hypothetical protein
MAGLRSAVVCRGSVRERLSNLVTDPVLSVNAAVDDDPGARDVLDLAEPHSLFAHELLNHGVKSLYTERRFEAECREDRHCLL